MEFGRVHGRIARTSSDSELRIIVSLEQSAGVTTVRDELVPRLEPGTDEPGLLFNVDQYTQETIATTLAQHGWEAVAVGVDGRDDQNLSSSSVTYVVRKL